MAGMARLGSLLGSIAQQVAPTKLGWQFGVSGDWLVRDDRGSPSLAGTRSKHSDFAHEGSTVNAERMIGFGSDGLEQPC